MALRDSAIVAYTETKVMAKSDRDVFVLAGEMLEALLDKTGTDKNEIDGLVMAGLTGTGHSHSYRREWTDPYGLMGPPGAFGLLSRAYEAKYGLDYRMLGKLAVTQRNHALMNENACEKLRVPITIDDYMNSRMIADPIRLLDCVMRADGAAGL